VAIADLRVMGLTGATIVVLGHLLLCSGQGLLHGFWFVVLLASENRLQPTPDAMRTSTACIGFTLVTVPSRPFVLITSHGGTGHPGEPATIRIPSAVAIISK
jgi:hypothetical protein